ncbi:hypothetical protein A2318_01625 [Candidatus Uhrbacteria bacterium RIFOXYB2_FULL_45_11]|uniref:prolyl oligopeptidase n=1 Tax=Candidatus Uhrbacteria bacterium RIFOXYB2_FULL_45_11 TaxID=1802421 RepID=A0A1F7WAP0_9BACT|nr:MAG: hypothetical protein A2318_01625 [Candidatus Uhrbacteria bacterium RIFOXYB2_FULL_45_11]
MQIPPTKREDTVDVIHGIPVADPFHWLEDIGDPGTLKWIEQQNLYAEEALKNERFETFADELARNFKVVNFSNPEPVNGKYFYIERQPDENQACVYVKQGLEGTPIKLIDPNGKIKDDTFSIDFWFVSHSGNHIVYGLSQGGDEMATLYVKDVATNKNLAEEIPHCRYSAVRWLPDDSGFFYTRNPRKGTVPENEEHLHTKVHLHILGTDPNQDEMIFGQNASKDAMIGISEVSPDGRYIAIDTAMTWTENDVYVYDTISKQTTPLIVGAGAKFDVNFLENKAIVFTNYRANNNRILSTPIENLFAPIDTWTELVAETPHIMQTVKFTKSSMIVEYLENACSTVTIFDHDGVKQTDLPLPAFSSLNGISTNPNEEEFFYGVDSFTFPKVCYRYNPKMNVFELYRATTNPIDPKNYTIKQEWFESKDGTRVPMFLFHRKDIVLDKQNATILYGYGGFANVDSPYFMRNYVPWMERGGVFASANLRGNAEFGEEWHKAGIKESKQNTFDDFIAAAEYLIANNYCDPAHLGILGGSNGGLLTAAVEVQRPDLFRAVCSRVPLTDMVRFPLFGIASRWIHEYGDPSIKEELEQILKWSPYHNVHEGVEYPSTLFMTGIKDTRVEPLHARKMTAILQTTNQTNPIFIFTETEAGHGAGKPIKKLVESAALMLSFFAERLHLKM